MEKVVNFADFVGVPEEEAVAFLGSNRNYEKEKERKEDLQKNPHKKLELDPKPLRELIADMTFKVNPYSSVARGQAVKGSDLDGGLVVTTEPVPKTQQQKFVDELRAQGFTAYTEAEVEEEGNKSVQNSPEYLKRMQARIKFRTEEELILNGEFNERSIYIAGTEIT